MAEELGQLFVVVGIELGKSRKANDSRAWRQDESGQLVFSLSIWDVRNLPLPTAVKILSIISAKEV